MEEPDIIEKFNRGDQHAFDVIFYKFYRPLCLYAEKMTGNQKAAEDVVIVVMFKLWEKNRDFNSFKAIYAYLRKAVRNSCLNYLRGERRKERIIQDLEYLATDHESDNERIEAEYLQLMHEKIEQLSPQQVTVVRMYLERIDYREIAKCLGISEQTVRNHKANAIIALKKFFGLG